MKQIRQEIKDKLSPLPKYNERRDYRASGDCICEKCGYEYRLHPLDTDKDRLSYDGQPFLHVLCNGDRVKL